MGPEISYFIIFQTDARDYRSSTLHLSLVHGCEKQLLLDFVQYHILLGLVEDLKQKLIAEREKNLSLEVKVREELCQVPSVLLILVALR
jgi:hypothetical protein